MWSGSPAGLSPTSFHSPNSLLLGVLNALKNGRLGAGWSGRVPGRLVSHFPPKQFTVRGSQFFLEMCPPFVSLLVSALTLAMQHFYSFVSRVCRCWCPAFLFISQVCYWWCPPLGAGHVAFLFICLPGLPLALPALFRWPRSTPILLSPRSVTAGVRPFPLAMQHFYSFVSQVCSFVSQVCHCWCPPFSAGHAAFLFICPTGLSLVVSALFCCFYSFVSQVCHMCLPGLSLVMSALFRWPCSISILLSHRSVTGVLVYWP